IDSADLPNLIPLKNGFVQTCIQAYTHDHHLIIRPDDVWLAILSQFQRYIVLHSEELRSYFVGFQGKKEISVETEQPLDEVDYTLVIRQFVDLMDENLVDKDLKNWILPSFTTTTPCDTTCASIMMMSTLKNFFIYHVLGGCGLASITLLGEKDDYEQILNRLSKLSQFGAETQTWASLLRPILARFIAAFYGIQDNEFWGTIVHHQHNGSGSNWYSGWITAFCVFNDYGQWQLRTTRSPQVPGPLVLDGIEYFALAEGGIPAGYCEVDLRLVDVIRQEEMNAYMVAGMMGARISGNEDTLSPFPAWFIFEKAR
ncbi:hypothetical protein BDN72DRAFT_742140, partial [Pluteus cervinus]